MRAVKLALLHFNLQALSIVLVSTDNTTVVAYINKEGGTRSTSLWDETQELFQVVMSHQWTLKAVHIPGRLNVIADLLSMDKQVLLTEAQRRRLLPGYSIPHCRSSVCLH